MMKAQTRFWFLLFGALLAASGRANAAPRDYLVGVYYFAGWWQQTPNKWMTAGRDWRPDFPGRIPVLGEYNDQETMDREIAAAARHGVDFFQILWYPNGGQLNEGVRLFLASTNAGRMHFTIELVNHPPFELATDRDWEVACQGWCAAMQHSSYLKIDGKPVFKIHGLDYFYQQNGNDPARVVARLDALRRIAEQNGLGRPLISGGVMPGGVPSATRLAPFDFVTTYMDMPNLLQKSELYPYDLLIQHAEAGWTRYAEQCSKPYVPYVPSGWDPRPWRDPRPSFAFPTRNEWTAALRRVKAALDRHPNLGIPATSGRTKMLLIYAWNEFGEGGIVAPTRGENAMKLEAIRDVFVSPDLDQAQNTNRPTLWLIGDSTVRNGRSDGAGGLWGWGDWLAPHFDPNKLRIVNRALGGRSSRTFLTEGLWAKVVAELRPGDFVIMQFGHNDGGERFKGTRPRASLRGNGEETEDGVVEQTGKAEAVHTFGWYLRRYIAETKAKGATPIVCSPIPRNDWKNGRVQRSKPGHAEWAAAAAEAGEAHFVDLNELVARRYEELGQSKVTKDYFVNEHTHTSKAGAQFNAEVVAQAVRNLQECKLKEFLITGK